MRIEATQAYYIKLGEGGLWEQECIVGGYLRVGFNDLQHDLALQGRWDQIKEFHSPYYKPRSLSSGVNQLKKFYTAADDVVWITFYADQLWWCFAQPEVELLEDGTRIRWVTNEWSNQSITGELLATSSLKGTLSAVQGYRGTICNVREAAYLLNKINGIVPPSVAATQELLEALYQRIEDVIRHLHWKDFELLVDLIFRQAGWQRTSDLGKVQRGIDLELYSPISQEIYKVQVKSSADRIEFEAYQDEFAQTDGFARFYFIVHSPNRNLDKSLEDTDIKLILPADIARWVVDYGLVEWVLGKVG